MTGDTLSLHAQWEIAVIGLAVVAVVLFVAARLISREPREDHLWAQAAARDARAAEQRESARQARAEQKRADGAALTDWAARLDDPEWLPFSDNDDDKATWVHRLVGPARVMADPLRVRLTALGAVVDRLRSTAGRPVAGEDFITRLIPHGVLVADDETAITRLLADLAADCERAIPDGLDAPAPLIVSGPEPVAPPQAPLHPRQRPGRRPPLPPVEEAEHLQPIDWDDATDTFAAFCEDGQ